MDQELVDKVFYYRSRNNGHYYDFQDVKIIKQFLQTVGVDLSTSEIIDFWIWRCGEWESSWIAPHSESNTVEWFYKFIKANHIDDEDY